MNYLHATELEKFIHFPTLLNLLSYEILKQYKTYKVKAVMKL